MANKEQHVATPASNDSPPAQASLDEEPKAERDENPQQHSFSLEDGTSDIEEPLTGYLKGWRLHILTTA